MDTIPHLHGVLTVMLANAHRNLYEAASGSGPVQLRGDGRVVLDGLISAPGDVLYLSNDGRFYSLLPDAELEQIAQSHRSRINRVIAVSEGINRTVSKKPLRESTFNLFDFEAYDAEADPVVAWRRARYPQARIDYYGDIKEHEWVDSISDAHDPEAIKRSVVQQHIDEHCRFVVGGYLHIDTGIVLTDSGRLAILAYRAMGGRLGCTALEALGESMGSRL